MTQALLSTTRSEDAILNTNEYNFWWRHPRTLYDYLLHDLPSRGHFVTMTWSTKCASGATNTTHTSGVYVPYSFRTVVWVLLRPRRTDQWNCCETGPTVFRPYPRRLVLCYVTAFRRRENVLISRKATTRWNRKDTTGCVQKNKER